MKKSAKILSIILAVIMILSAVPMAAFADSSDFVINEYGVLTAYNGAGGDIVIPDGVTAIGDGVFGGNANITSVIFPSSVKTIGYASFRECTSLQTVTFSEGLETLGEKSFQLCDNIQTLELPSSLRTICKEALTLMNGIKNLVIPEGVTTIENLALGSLCYLESISFPASATSIGFDLFWDCERLASVTVDPANPVYDSRDNCNAIIETATNTLVSGSISTVIPDSVTSIGPLSFEQMTGLESITIPDSVTSIGPSAFQYCYSLKSITIPDSVTSIGMGTFAYDDQLTSVTLHDGITSIGDGAFDNYGNLKTVYYPCDDNVETIKGFMSPHGTFTYTPLHDVVSYTDNGDGTHTGSCACGSFKTEKEAHNFVDGVCSLCGATDGFKNIREIIATVPDFPTTEEDAWTNENGAKVYVSNGFLEFQDMSTYLDNPVIKSGDNYYESIAPENVYVVKNGVLDCIIVSRLFEGDVIGTYRPTCKHAKAEIVNGEAATCTKDGLTDGKYCPDCETWLVPQETIPAINHANAEIVNGKAATCTEDGLTDGKYCPDCETWLVPQETIPAINHANAEIVIGKAATCTEDGLTDGTFCPDCETWIIPREVIPATDHPNAYNENGEAETCSSSGVTPGVYCPDCDKYISGHETIEPHPHPLADEYIDNEDGTHSQHCTECGEPITVSEHTFVDGVCVCGAKKPVTVLDIISTNKDFPTDYANAWLNEAGGTLIYKADINFIFFETAEGDNTWNIDANCEVETDGDNYSFIDFIFNMEDGVLKSVTMTGQYSSLKGTYAPHTHAYTDLYVDNGDGTHTGSCTCGAVNPEKEEHTFVDGVCVCGAKEPSEPNVKGVICDPGPDGYKTLHATVLNHPVKLQIVDKDGNTVTLARDNPKVSIQAYDADGNEVEELDRTAAYEVWTISNQYLKEGEYTLISKNTDNVWDAVEDGCDFEVTYSRSNVRINSISSSLVEAKRCEKFNVEVVTGRDVLKVTIQCNGVDYKTFTPSGKNVFGDNVFNCFVASNTFGDATITVKYKTADGWFDCTNVYDIVSIGEVNTPKTVVIL